MAYCIDDANLAQQKWRKDEKEQIHWETFAEDPEKHGRKRRFQFVLNERIRQMHHLFQSIFRLEYSLNLKI